MKRDELLAIGNWVSYADKPYKVVEILCEYKKLTRR